MPRSSDPNKSKSYNKKLYPTCNHITDIPLPYSSLKCFTKAEQDYIITLHENDVTFEDLFNPHKDQENEELTESDLYELSIVNPETPKNKNEISKLCEQVRRNWTPLERYSRLSSSLRFDRVKYQFQPHPQLQKKHVGRA